MIYEECSDQGGHWGSTVHTLVVYYFPANGQTNPDVFFSLKPSALPWESSIFQLIKFNVSEELTNKHTH